MAIAAHLGGTATAQAPGVTAHAAPTDKSVLITNSELDAVVRTLQTNKVITQRVLEGGTFSVNVRHITGAETALIHGRIAEVWIVRDGTGTLATGGELVDAKPGSGPGEFRGASIKGGVERALKAGDIVFIPPGVAHGMRESDSITYLNVRFEVEAGKSR